MTLVATFPIAGFPTIHTAGCAHTLRGHVATPSAHAVRTGRFADCLSDEQQTDALRTAFANWQD